MFEGGVMTLSLDKVEALAPDQASLDAARKLLKPGAWPAVAADGAGLVWGECQGSGATPYRIVVCETDAGYKCSCPSRKFPCKHSLALMWMRADGKVAFATAPAPAWVNDWVSRRRGPSAAASDDAKPRASMDAAAAAETSVESDPKTEARAAAARERNRQEREASILAGLDDLNVWLADQLDRGLAGFAAHAGKDCRLIAQRLVDAKASGLATRMESLTSRLFTLPESARPTAAMQELGQAHLLAAAYRRQKMLPDELRADVRQAIGWPVTREALLADQNAARAEGLWRVVGTISEVQPDKLRRLETWLWHEGLEAGPRFAVLIDFVPVATGAASSGYSVGDRIEAELVFYPSAVPMRAQIVRPLSGATACGDPLELPEQKLDAAYQDYEEALRRLPWLGVFPMCMRDARLRRHGSQFFLCNRTEGGAGTALPLAPAQAALASPLLSCSSLDAVGLWDGSRFTLCWAQTELGRWVNS
jgi:SWIM zinc finger